MPEVYLKLVAESLFGVHKAWTDIRSSDRRDDAHIECIVGIQSAQRLVPFVADVVEPPPGEQRESWLAGILTHLDTLQIATCFVGNAFPLTGSNPLAEEARRSVNKADLAATDLVRAARHIKNLLRVRDFTANASAYADKDQADLAAFVETILDDVDEAERMETMPPVSEVEQPPITPAKGNSIAGADEAVRSSVPMPIVAGRIPAAPPNDVELNAPHPASWIAKRFGIDVGVLNKRLERWRRKHDDCCVVVSDRKPREPKYLYYLSAIMSLIDELLSESSKQGASSEMSA